MKIVKILGVVLVAAVVGTGIYAFSAGKDAPQKVKDAFVQKFPDVKKVKWEMENENEWEGEFKMKRVEYSANFLEDGTWIETEHEIKKKDIPENIKIILMTEYPDFKIEEVEISETIDGSVYEIELEKGKSEMDVIIDMTGIIFKTEKLIDD